MRLWHQELLPVLSRQHIQGQHRECCAMRGNGWAKKHSTVDYVFTYNPLNLVYYHVMVMAVMNHRGIRVDPLWTYPRYRGKRCEEWEEGVLGELLFELPPNFDKIIYPEHDDLYFNECLDNLRRKGFSMIGIETKKVGG